MPAPTSEDDLKRRARRRLIGAVALTLAAVIVLPLLLEDEPPPAGQLEVHMPPVAELPKAGQAPIAPIAPPPEPAATSPSVPPAPAASAMAGADKPDSSPPASTQAKPTKLAEANASEKPLSKPDLADRPKPDTADKPKPDSAEKPKTDPVDTSKPAKPATSGFVVQLGAFSHADKAVELKNRVESLGLASYTDRSGALTRLRVGPFSSREAAIEAAQRLSENGVQGQVMPK